MQTDQPRPVRRGEELDLERLGSYLEEQIPGISGTLTLLQFPGGFSNLTYLLSVGDREFVLRRPPFGANIRSAHDMGREFTILSGLKKVYSKIPEPVLYTEDESIIGAPFYLMERVEGVILRKGDPDAIMLDDETMEGVAEAMLDTFVELHEVDYAAVGLGDYKRPGSYVERQVRGWSKRYIRSRTDDVPDLEKAGRWLDDHMPGDSDSAFIHNDFKYDNLVLDKNDPKQVVAVLDWEMATVGDPLMDLGTSLGYWMNHDDPAFLQELSFCPTNLPGNPTREELAQAYSVKSGRDVGHLVYYYVYGLFKIATIVQQIYFRFKTGHTNDQRFANLIEMVRLCGKMASLAIERKRIDRLF